VPHRASGSPRCGAAATDDAARADGLTLLGLLEGAPVGWGEQWRKCASAATSAVT
jgi:hypothetical protein